MSGRVRTVQEWGGGPDDVTDAEDEAGRVDRWREEKEMRTALANAAPNMPATLEVVRYRLDSVAVR